MTLFSLAEGIRRCTACPLYKSRLLAVPGEGIGKIIVIGEAPGAEENRLGQPFVGRSGKFLDEMLKIAKMERKNIFLTEAVKCHPPENRSPTAGELKICKVLWLEKQIELIKPKLIIILGRVALRSVLNQTNVSKLRGKIITKDKQKYLITYHPAAGMRFPKIKEAMVKDFQKMRNHL